MIMIFVFSGQDAPKSSQVSGVFSALARKILMFVLPECSLRDRLDANMDFLVRKAAHVTIYILLAFFATMSIYFWGVKKRTAIISAFVMCVVFASADEFHQSFVSGRGASWKDVVIDSCGVAVGTLIPAAVLSRKKRGVKPEK